MAVSIDIPGGAALLSFLITCWQWTVARRFPLHQRVRPCGEQPPVTVLKPLKALDSETERCLRSWLEQQYPPGIQILFGVACDQDPVCPLARRLLQDYPKVDAQLVLCPERLGINAKVSTLIQLERQARHEWLVISDADVWAPADLLVDLMAALRDPQVGLVHCFYFLANPSTWAMRWEAIAINADFWSQVLQSRSVKPIDFALGAVMAAQGSQLDAIGGFSALSDYLADDYQLGHRIARAGRRINLVPTVVRCYSEPSTWQQAVQHQLRWARTFRFCQPIPYFFSILGNATFWPLLWVLVEPGGWSLSFAVLCILIRLASALDNQGRLTQSIDHLRFWWMIPLKDLSMVILWALAFLGNRVRWRGVKYRVLPGGKLEKVANF